MNYQIQSKDDFTAGAVLTITIPEEDLDAKALYTISVDQPDFLVPFHYCNIDGQFQFTYRLANYTKLTYRFGARPTGEYIKFWNRILQPLVDCDDWFLNPSAFVLDVQYMYIGKDGETIAYLYVPTQNNSIATKSLQDLAIELAQKNPAADVSVENMALRSIMQDFRPNDFLKMLQDNAPHQANVLEYAPKPVQQPVKNVEIQPAEQSQQQHSGKNVQPKSLPDGDEIVIDFSKGKEEKEKPEKAKKTGKTSGFFGGKKEKPAKVLEKKSIFKSKENKSKEIIAGVEVERPEKYENAAPVYMAKDVESEETCVEEAVFGAHLQLVGRGALPVTISVQAEPGEPFTIGRYDVSIAQKQSSFEFAKDTVAVSRHHAAIEKKEDGSYYVVDQNSKAGTFLNGERLTPGVPYAITWGDCIAFGTGEARYTWEK